MNAGRELDAKVAERVMGWTHIDPRLYSGYKNGVPIGPNEIRKPGWPPRLGAKVVPAYSTDISAAWAVVEKMRDRPCFVEIIHDGMMWVCTFDSGIRNTPVYCASAFTPPEAICLAALKAVEEQGDKG